MLRQLKSNLSLNTLYACAKMRAEKVKSEVISKLFFGHNPYLSSMRWPMITQFISVLCFNHSANSKTPSRISHDSKSVRTHSIMEIICYWFIHEAFFPETNMIFVMTSVTLPLIELAWVVRCPAYDQLYQSVPHQCEYHELKVSIKIWKNINISDRT